MLAFEDNAPVGYIHTTFAPTADKHSFDHTTGQICFLCIDPKYHDVSGAAAALIQAGEHYLAELGATKIFGGSPSPSAPFYTAFYSGGEALGFLLSDQIIVNAFQEANYQIHKKTKWFHLDLRSYAPSTPLETIGYYAELAVEIHEIPEARSWWEGCIQSNGIWFDATAYLITTSQPIARLRVRISYPDTENFLAMYGGTWLASIIELRAHPDHADDSVKRYLLEEVINYLMTQKQVVQIEAHAAEDSPLFTLLHNRDWFERDNGLIFIKEL
jgi:ribosomal protein S18 acetylase RimI-like enzyme